MVHTAKFYMKVEEQLISHLETWYSRRLVDIENEINDRFYGINLVFRGGFHAKAMFLTVDFIKFLGKADIEESDYSEVETMLNSILSVFGISIDELTLIRIDYRIDVLVENPEERKLLLQLYKKAIEKFRFQKKYDQYKSSIYFNSKSVQANVYDKEQERSDKNIVSEDYEKNILRFEVRLQNKHLNSRKHSKHRVAKTLENYFKEELMYKYMEQKMGKILYKGDYYKPYHYKKIIENSSLKPKEKIELVDFLVSVSQRGITFTKSEMTKYKFRKCLNQLEELNINPISIPKNYKIALKDGCVKNPLYK